MQVRDAMPSDGAACAAIYAPYVRDTAVTFELDAPDGAAFAQRIVAAQDRHAWVVVERDSRVVGYAYGSAYKARAAYRWTCEVSVYLEVGLRRTGAGRHLYEALFARLVERGYRVAVAAMTLPNDASAGLHRAMGFETVGIFQAVGWKHDRWHDVMCSQRALVHPTSNPHEQPAEPH